MKYGQVFDNMSVSWLERLQRQEWAAPRLAGGGKLAQLYTDTQALEALYRQMTSAEQQALLCILTCFGTEPFTKEALMKRAPGHMAGAAVAVGLAGLRACGVLATFRKAWGERIYALPEDGFAAWHALLLPPLLPADGQESAAAALSAPFGSDSEQGREPIELPYACHERGLAQQLFHFLQACSMQELTLTNKGTLHKKLIQKLTGGLLLPDEAVKLCGLPYAHADAYTPGTALLLDLALRLGLLLHRGEKLNVAHPAVAPWLRLSFEQQQRQLLELWAAYFRQRPVWLQHCQALLLRAVPHAWYSVQGLLDWQRSHGAASGAGGREAAADGERRQQLLEQLLLPMHLFRWLELAKDRSGELQFRWLLPSSDSGAGAAHFAETGPCMYVQPDFELLLAPDAPASLEWEVAAFAELISSGVVRLYKLTKESFYRACESGKDWRNFIQTLQQYACYEVPEPMIGTLEQWGGQFGRLCFEEVTLLRCESAELAALVAANEACRPLLRETAGDSAFIVRRADVPQLSKQLERMGCRPRKAPVDPAVPRKEQAESDQAEPLHGGLLDARDPLLLYEPDDSPDEFAELYPFLQEIPPLWLKEFKEYHASTRKDMIRKAIEWKSCLKVKHQGEERLIVPRVLYEERAGWTLVGLEQQNEIRLGPEDWKEMKLILPGINDE